MANRLAEVKKHPGRRPEPLSAGNQLRPAASAGRELSLRVPEERFDAMMEETNG